MTIEPGYCACGRRLHYESDALQEAVERMIAYAGGDPFITVVVGDKRFRVQRHYIALHGLKAEELVNGSVPCEVV